MHHSLNTYRTRNDTSLEKWRLPPVLLGYVALDAYFRYAWRDTERSRSAEVQNVSVVSDQKPTAGWDK